jgi:hypothetical protein
MRTTPGRPRHLGPLDDGPWLRDRTTARICGLISVLAVLVVLGVLGSGARIDPRSPRSSILFFVLLLGVIGGLLGPLGTIILWLQGRLIQFCPDCLKSMTRGARVCPYCGFRDEQTPTATPAATPLHQPRRSA